ncbi:MAG: tRNA (N6-isopentenyl adenosine(37)-C2)-methylthiotransferase MiaB [Spirochaetes bacterium]|nr:tRNA (N6-isopentenyl adenosine(37)-C2)-methylthiotransferase MiaB [Spirochaetota bacterium]
MGTTYHIETFGCQMNKHDSELMALSMEEASFTPAADASSADVVIFNTCSVRDHAEQRALSRLRSLGKQGKNRKRIVVIAGCMAQRIGRRLLDEKTADIIVGPYQSPSMGRLIMAHMENPASAAYLSQEAGDFSTRIVPEGNVRIGGPPWHSWVTITHGCENFCSYCIVPIVRGRLISFPSDAILAHIRDLAGKGTREITLLGQNVNQYGMDTGDIPFSRLLESAAEVPGIERIGFLTSHPAAFPVEILRVIRDHPNISRSIHLPLQSGSDRVLAMMNRRYTVSDYMEIVEAARSILENCALSTDLIVGFPGETEEDFGATLDALEKIHFDDAFTYAYSPRSGTPASLIPESLTRPEKMERLSRLIQVQRQISSRKLNERIDREEEVIIEKFSKKSSAKVMGKTFLNHVAVVPGTADDIGRKLRIRVIGVRGSTLRGARLA